MEISNNEVLLSFILPVYNVELYLRECVESILQQITLECEIILVDDGSTDASGEICDQYAAANPMVRVIRKGNCGASAARNTGIAVAKGKYIAFVDSDDKITSGCMADILNWIQNEGADLCFLRAVKIFPDGTRTDLGECIEKAKLKSQSRESAISHLASRPKYPGGVWAKLYRREFLLDNQLYFPLERWYSAEDLSFIRDCIICAHSFDALDVPYYEYRQSRQGSITSSITARNFYDLFRFITDSAEKLNVNKKPRDAISKSLMSFACYEYAVLLHLYRLIPDLDQKDTLAKLKEYKWVLMFANNAKEYVILFCCSLFGIRLTSYLVHQYRKRA